MPLIESCLREKRVKHQALVCEEFQPTSARSSESVRRMKYCTVILCPLSIIALHYSVFRRVAW